MPFGDPVLTRGRYSARFAQNAQDLVRAQNLRARCFSTHAPDSDAFDAECRHMMVLDRQTDELVCCFRIRLFQGAADLDRSYSAQFYDLTRLSGFPGRIAELGRFCVRPGRRDPDILRIAWGALARFVDANDIGLLTGCSSFAGTEVSAYLDSFALLKAAHLAPMRWMPGIKSGEVFRYSELVRHSPDRTRGLAQMPPLLRSYLRMGGWVSDHAVVDRQMNTLHVFTALETEAIPKPRRRQLLAISA
ncbi:GNAT family N-acyltransferase [Sedimentitalea sp. JM2-8]|uniref:L-ornithine N(alpha)-acyltransferase n=1 Tax=Sedimentitalea xiamensis TaxID=3050037 RepID=A0ABT7FDA8_9RHOB|nr:GNAT family N-acyltransferase [Sedimentitalea xiamensis]MDK3073097.1 GNAT family N-acyltransferase [Sedimentitalea xiamensis]